MGSDANSRWIILQLNPVVRLLVLENWSVWVKTHTSGVTSVVSSRGAWLAQSLEHVTLGCEFKPHAVSGAYLKKKEKK